MATKTLKTITVSLIGDGEPVQLEFSDTVDNPIASYMLDDFARENHMHGVDGGGEYYIPFHAVDFIIVGETTAEVADKGDPYYCE